ncbi:hypothetical protein [Pontibacillus litoralis]|uniref:Uncharacterized protein n=1 Tax=Pontibacillus litoralis JSM 072002 TaxID=1385512 RepID=A0A0A5G1G3_9BACI|nr:hypothetical protein [Pontibacillus litoralis]KGX85884.1 hypothetical protein N784_06685 [Pontibacillus litoralis JSM 072002]
MHFGEVLGIIGSIASIISIIGAVVSWKKANKAKLYSDIYYTTDTKESLQAVFVRLQGIQELTYKLNSNNKRGFNQEKEIRNYEEIMQKIIYLINIMPTGFTIILSRLRTLKETFDSKIQKEEIMDSQELFTFKNSLGLCIEDVKGETQNLRKELDDLQSNATL